MTASLVLMEWLQIIWSELIGTVVEVPGEVKRPRRRYNSPLRAGQAEQTRTRVLDAAYRLFADRGYAGTTIAAVASEAGVSPETIYLIFGGKRGLLEGVIGMAIAPEADPAAQEESLWSELVHVSDPRYRLHAMIEYSCAILARTAPVHAVIRGAADKEAFAAALGRRLLQERLTQQTERIRQHLDGHLREGLSASGAGERYCALTSPELYHTLTVEFGWTTDQHRSWLTELLTSELLGLHSEREFV
jgi:AcrR family transcriptional regulator